MFSFYPMAAVVLAASPVRSFQDLVALSHKQALTAGSGGNGTPQHLVLEMFKGATGAKILHIPYNGGAPALVALLGTQNDVVFSHWPECLPHVKSGKLGTLAVATETRLAQMRRHTNHGGKIMAVSPLATFAFAGAAPRYGTCSHCSPVRILNFKCG